MHNRPRPAATARLLSADELRNNRQKICGPPDFVEEPAKAGFKVLELCTLVRCCAGRRPAAAAAAQLPALRLLSGLVLAQGALVPCLRRTYAKAHCIGVGCTTRRCSAYSSSL
jgi:hypothetical protein